MKRFLSLLVLLAVSVIPLWAQQVTIKGTVLDAETDETLPGVNIIITGTTSGTVTDFNGNFTLQAQLTDKLSLSSIGYETQLMEIAGRSVLNIKLQPSSESLEEVVVVGYGVQKKESVVGAIAQVESKELLATGVSDVTQALSGQLPGVVTTQNNGRPGEEGAEILIRGKSSWVDSSPLVMVDGIERSFSDIDPNEIETISILKDASATAVYGTRGANGVVLVTTKRGTESKPKISVSFMQGIKEATALPEYVDAYNTLLHANVAMKNDGNFAGLTSQAELENYKRGDQPYIYPDVNWIEEMIQRGTTSTFNINVTGGTKRVKYFTSLGYNHEGDILRSEKVGNLDPRFYSHRYNLRSNLDFDLTKTTRVKVNVSASHKIQNGNSGYYGDFFRNIYQVGVNYSPLYYGPDALEQYPDAEEPNAGDIRYAQGVGEGKNPYTILHNGLARFDTDTHVLESRRKTTTDLNTDIGLNQDLSFITEGLTASALVSVNTKTAYERAETQQGASYILNENGTWRRMPSLDLDLEPLAFHTDRIQNNTRKFYYEAKVNYDRQFGKHYVTGLGIFNRSHKDVSTNSSTIQPSYRQEAWAARATYAYNLKYMFEVNLGYSGSEQFAPGNRFGFFPAFAVGWNAAEESFIKDKLPFIDKLKFRFSYGKTGSDKASGRWLYENEGYTPYWQSSTQALFGATYGQQGVYYFNEGKIANPVAQWEESLKQNFGVEIGLFNNKLTFSADIFKEDREKILMTVTTVPDYASVDLKPLNLGITKNHGFELELGYRNKTAFGLGYSAKANFSFNENRVVFRDDAEALPDYQKDAGFPIGTQRQYLQDELYQSVDDAVNYLHRNPNVMPGDVRFVDYNADGVINEQDKVALEGTQYPLYSYGINLGADYKGFSITATFQGVEDKNSYFNNIAADPFYKSHNRIYGYQVDDYWTPDNTDAFYPTVHMNASLKDANNNLSYAQRYVETSYLRLKTLQLAYTFRPKWQKFPVDYFMIYVNGNNLWTYSEFGALGDPEKTSFTPGASNSYPLLKRYNLGLKFNF